MPIKLGFSKTKTSDGIKVLINKRLNDSDLKKLQQTTDCETLAIWNLKLPSLEFLSSVPTLRSVELYAGSVADYSVLPKLPKLKVLFLNGVGNVDLAFVSDMKQLRKLSLLYLRKFKALPDLRKCRALAHVMLWNCKQLTNVTSLAHAPALAALEILDTPQQPKDLEFVIKKSTVKTVAAQFGSSKLNLEFDGLLEKHGKKRH
jgi:hypothetical protein